MDHSETIEFLGDFGAPAESVISLQEPLGPHHLSLLDLHREGTRSRIRVALEAVVQLGVRQVLYIVRGPVSADLLLKLRHVLTQRGAADHLGIIEPGLLRVVPLAPTKKRGAGVCAVNRKDRGAVGTIPGLAFGSLSTGASGTARSFHARLFELIDASTRLLVDAGVDSEDALSLVGRALFFRFVIDRDIVSSHHLRSIAPNARKFEDALTDRDGVEAVSAWLDTTFNGNLLPLGASWGTLFRSSARGAAICKQLTRIVSRTNAYGQQDFEWNTLDFGHIPVGLLSEVYESWSHANTPDRARRESAFYTPGAVAEFVVEEGLRGVNAPYRARVLDPSAGAGVFLVAAFRALVKARWAHDGKRPSHDIVREILATQLTGFEVNDPALRLCALALYLTALELDPEPEPPSRLRFPDLRDVGVLWDARSEGDLERAARSLPPLGSLGSHVPDVHQGRYDLVAGNPPWTAWKKTRERDATELDGLRRQVEAMLTPVVKARTGYESARFTMIEYEPDLAFWWRALTWAKPSGMIALALHARFLFRTTAEGSNARRNLLRGARISGIVNGSALRQTRVWPQHEAPFCVVFAQNLPSADGEGFMFVSPQVDSGLNDEGHLRIDAAAARPVFVPEVEQSSWRLKTLFRGGPLDVSIMSRLTSSVDKKSHHPRLDEWWPNDFSSLGFIKGRSSTQRECRELSGRPLLNSSTPVGARIDSTTLDRFSFKTVTEPRTGRWKRQHPDEARQGLAPRVFRGPLVIVRQSPPVSRCEPRVHITVDDVVYDDSFFGFSAAWHPNAERVANYLLIWLSSSVALYILLLSAPRFGVERERLLLEDLRSLPITPWDCLSPADQSEFDQAATVLTTAHTFEPTVANSLIARVLGLSEEDLECIEDTLSISLPTRPAEKRAEAPPTYNETKRYRERVREILAPMLAYSRREIRVEPLSDELDDPWRVFVIQSLPSAPAKDHLRTSKIVQSALEVATLQCASRVVLPKLAPGAIVVGVFGQYRYWTRSQARALALDLLHDHEAMGVLRGDA